MVIIHDLVGRRYTEYIPGPEWSLVKGRASTLKLPLTGLAIISSFSIR